jgi:hypothetical protein
MSSSDDSTERLRAFFRREAETVDEHPSPERIAAYHEHRLAPEEMEEIRAHLVVCHQCTAELLALAALPAEEGEPVSEMSRADLDAAWQRQRAHLFAEAPVAPRQSRRAGMPPLRRAWATAASLGLAAALLAVVVIDQRRTLERLERPQANPPLVNLEPVDSVRQALRKVTEVSIPPEGERIWVILNPSAELDSSPYDIELVAQDGTLAFRFEDVPSSEAGNIRLEIPHGVLQAGSYRALLTQGRGRERHVVAEFALKVLSASP